MPCQAFSILFGAQIIILSTGRVNPFRESLHPKEKAWERKYMEHNPVIHFQELLTGTAN